MSGDSYTLIDFGEGRKLESLSGYLVDRPSASAAYTTRTGDPSWDRVDASYDATSKSWRFHSPWPSSLQIDCEYFRMPVQPTPFGHIGLFPEQFENWRWLVQRGQALQRGQAPPGALQRGQAPPGDSIAFTATPAWGLNLFGYTGGSTLALVSSGFAVAHVDAARPNVEACRRAAQHNGWGDAAIRYLVDDADKFVRREIRRGRRYHMIVLDPPAYGHAPGGRAWRLERDLWPLLDRCLELLEHDFGLLITGHSPQVDQRDIVGFLTRHEKLQAQWRVAGLKLESGRSQLRDLRGRELDAGFFVRLWSNQGPAV